VAVGLTCSRAEDPGTCGTRAKELAASEACGIHAQKLPPARGSA
jgi:hypothetical protein